jgi:monothiol glutaredoxin
MKISLIDVNHSCKLHNILKDFKMTLSEQIQKDIKTNSIILYMKGTRLMPMCGFSSTMVNILNMHGIEYKDINVLEDPEIRVQLSAFSNWPTIPQLFVNGELVGGCDIAIELHNNGELEKIFANAGK